MRAGDGCCGGELCAVADGLCACFDGDFGGGEAPLMMIAT
jgi:hypothetical protein